MKTAVVTGCTKGIGGAITEKLLNEGCLVYGCYESDKENADRFYQNLEDKKGNCFLYQADLSKIDGIEEFTNIVKLNLPKIDYLVLNAGMTDRTSFRDINYEMWNKVMHVNLYAPLFLIQGLDSIINDNGRIILIGSILGQYPHAMSLSYAVSKAGIHQLAKNLVKEYSSRKITVNAIAPGFTNTPWQKSKSPERRKRIEDKIALKRFAEPEEVANLCWAVFENPYINGSIINIDGGYDYM